MLNSVDELIRLLAEKDYIIDRKSAIAVFLALKLEKPLLVEGPPGCGKTELAKVIAKVLDLDLIRLQCYEGLDYTHALYEWNYPKQLLEIKMMQQVDENEVKKRIYSEEFLIERPLLKAIKSDKRVVLLIDEIDRADPEFEGFLLEFLGEFQVTIPELGTIKAKDKPFVFITSNKTRDLSDALKRRCLYLYLNYPDEEKELEIVRRKVREIDVEKARKVIKIVNSVRQDEEILHKPGIAETIDLVNAINLLGAESEEDIKSLVVNVLLKDEDDIRHFEGIKNGRRKENNKDS
ncbi:MoxR family ATPase [Saccharolobus solfataricus]|uniref:ATPase n=2 Tax=Saccharolobus solfataricus TaxID=2287 RepID=A0A0E3KCH3_SACSO|nr:MoxR family ATPase [Saccharolobus solfataricus]AKA74398.1 MoxR family ATPase [Saccharolobus solfataricus]AKA77093.1 MoxR family ATPase [Saccharolobus solfataricus]AKA79786.1 MoxR family ATPase [Saccharolobus solfataricus]AZF68878.1 MoxR family ATPase [Saccharolobus solfataricus]AZF71498.1 MoxR family ATPase [Saccharolobus solfataricus]